MMRVFTCVRGIYAMGMDGNQRIKLGLSSPPALFKAGSLIWCSGLDGLKLPGASLVSVYPLPAGVL